MSGQEREHKRFSPSQAERFFACPGSTNLLRRLPARPPSQWAIEGTIAHAVLEAGLRAGVRTAKEAHAESIYWADDLNTLDNHFYFAIDVALRYVYEILDQYPDAIMELETSLYVPCEAAPGECDGYCDTFIYVPSIETAFIIDYKHGAGIAKDAIGNRQLKQYAAGIVWGEFDRSSLSKIVMTIIQPRAFHELGTVRECEITPYELYEYLDELNQAVQLNLQPDAPLRPDDNGKTTDHCRFCDARTMCPAREAQALTVVNQTFSQIGQVIAPSIPDVKSLDLHRLGQIRFYAPMLRKWLDDVDAYILELIQHGQAIPGTKVVQANVRRRYYGDEEDIAIRLAALTNMPAEEFMSRKLIGIADAEKLVVEAFKSRVGRGKKTAAAEDAKKAFAFFTLKDTSGNLVLADENDPRPPANRATAFSQIGAIIGEQQ